MENQIKIKLIKSIELNNFKIDLKELPNLFYRVDISVDHGYNIFKSVEIQDLSVAMAIFDNKITEIEDKT